MGIKAKEFVARYPRLYHATRVGGWCLIDQIGILSTSALLDHFEVNGKDRENIESKHRAGSVEIPDRPCPCATIRDQKPMSENALRRCLVGMTPREWYELLNRKVFFWVTEDRLNRLLAAYPGEGHDVITIDTARLVERYSNKIKLSHINAGAAGPAFAKRGRDLFKSFEEFPTGLWRQEGKRAVAELTIENCVKDVRDFTIRVERRKEGEPTQVLWEPGDMK
jgi:hypothetical protein